MKSLLAWVAALLLLLGLTSCGQKAAPPLVEDDPNTLVVLASSELRDVEALLPKVEQQTGVKLQLKYVGTLEAIERLQGSEKVDGVWLASNRYAMLIPAVRKRLLASERTMITPVVLGIKADKAKALGWVGNDNVTWKDIADAAVAGKFTFGMTNPTASNSGFAGLLGLACALSGKGDALEEKDIDAPRLAAFFRAQKLTAGSSGWLAQAYLNEQGHIDGLINYAATLSSLNRDERLKQKLTLIYPKDGLFTADYPFSLVNPDKRAAYDKVLAYLRGREFQSAMTRATLRRPVNAEVSAADGDQRSFAELTFPARLEVVDAVLSQFEHALRPATDSSFVLDHSGSMASDKRMERLQTALMGLAGGDQSMSGRMNRFRNRERVFILPFDHSVESEREFQLGQDDQANAQTMAEIKAEVAKLMPRGGTAMFEAVQSAYKSAALRRRTEPERLYTIVVMTDGESNGSLKLADFQAWYRALPAADQGIKIFPVLFGEAQNQQLQALAELSGGRVFDARKADLTLVFKEIRGYQ